MGTSCVPPVLVRFFSCETLCSAERGFFRNRAPGTAHGPSSAQPKPTTPAASTSAHGECPLDADAPVGLALEVAAVRRRLGLAAKSHRIHVTLAPRIPTPVSSPRNLRRLGTPPRPRCDRDRLFPVKGRASQVPSTAEHEVSRSPSRSRLALQSPLLEALAQLDDAPFSSVRKSSPVRKSRSRPKVP